MTLQNLSKKLWEEDPGYFRIKQSVKTILAIAIISLITIAMPMPVMFFSAITVGFSIQAITGDTQKQQIKFILTAFPLYFICFILGRVTESNQLYSSVLLVFLGFIAIYLKKYGSTFDLAPIIGWAFAFLGIILPPEQQIEWQILASMIVGFSIAGLTYLFIFPVKKIELYYVNVTKFFKEYCFMLHWLAHVLIHKTTFKDFQEKKIAYKNYIFHLMIVNGEIARNQSDATAIDAERINLIYSKQYALAKVISMIIEGFESLIEQPDGFSDDIIATHLFTIFVIYAAAISHFDLTIIAKDQKQVLTIFRIMENKLAELQRLILQSSFIKKSYLIALININLGLRLILKNIQQLEQNHAQ